MNTKVSTIVGNGPEPENAGKIINGCGGIVAKLAKVKLYELLLHCTFYFKCIS